MDYFTLFNLPQAYEVDLTSLAPRYQELQRQYHPDRFSTASESEQLQAIQKTATINDAYQTLKHPLKRAEYLLGLHGIDVQNEQCTMHDTAFLMEQLELREQLDNIAQGVKRQDADAEDKLSLFSRQVKAMTKEKNSALNAAFSSNNWDGAADIARKLRFLDKLRQQIEQIEEQLFEF